MTDQAAGLTPEMQEVSERYRRQRITDVVFPWNPQPDQTQALPIAHHQEI